LVKSRREVFALDIGTRTIAGLVIRKNDKADNIIACDIIEHESRVMYDGQIHDIEAVAKGVREIKQRLEKKVGYKLSKAAVAAAGRALYTIEGKAEKTISPYLEITEEDIRSLEADALAMTIKKLSEKDKRKALDNYYCVGFSPIKWFLNDEALDNLLGQKGRHISVEIVATFLPRTVVEGLLTVLERCDLKLDSLTLEPIAAGDVVVVPGMRKLNIALVDIGAGTSDIAISKDGSIFAYGMVPLAGDEITERICEKFLLEFGEGERLKRELSSDKIIRYKDILGVEHEEHAQDIFEAISPSISEISSAIARKILELNGKAPAAVLCIGGGSLMPNLSEYIAAQLELPKERVGIKTRDGLGHITGCEDFSSPFSITPIGIGINALHGTNLSFIEVWVNDKPVNMIGQGKSTLLDALIYSGLSAVDIFGRPGAALTFTLNGKLQIVRGQMPKPAVVTIDGQAASMELPVYDGAKINFTPAKDGKPAKAKLKDYISKEYYQGIKINGRFFEIKPIIKMNGNIALPEDDIVDDAAIVLESREMILSDIFNLISFKPQDVKGKLVMEINGVPAGFASEVKNNDEIEVYWENIDA